MASRDFTHLLMHMACVLFYELCKAHVIWAQFREPVEDTGLTGVKEGKVLGHLWVEQSCTFHVQKETLSGIQYTKGTVVHKAKNFCSSAYRLVKFNTVECLCYTTVKVRLARESTGLTCCESTYQQFCSLQAKWSLVQDCSPSLHAGRIKEETTESSLNSCASYLVMMML